MSVIDLRPAEVDMIAYAGDTTTVRIDVTGADYSAFSWAGQIRLDHDSGIDASFVITPDLNGAFVTVDSDASEALMLAGTAEEPVYGAPKDSLVRVYYGIYDVQVEDAGVVKTLVHGLFSLYADVTRL